MVYILRKIKYMVGFYFLSFTWGILMTTVGLLVAFGLLVTGHKPKRWGGCMYFVVGNENWGGVSLGPVFLTDKSSSNSTKNHEHGHSWQNCFFGPLMLFLVCIPSATRYHYRNWLVKSGRRKFSDLSEYDSVWYEAQATKLGNKYIIFWK